MKYLSTRMNTGKVSSAHAVSMGMVPGGGLFVPEEIPKVDHELIEKMKEMSYQEIALEILKLYFTDYSLAELKDYIHRAYSEDKFSHELKTPVVKLEDDLYVSELWHGPTGAFKDMALQIMPRIFSGARKKTGVKEESMILVATSGDTGKAALEGFKDIEGVKIAVFYPSDGVSEVQRLQMETTEGDNVAVASVIGNFDDCQSKVKDIFEDREFSESFDKVRFSSANSINLARLIPQIIYYFASYAQVSHDLEYREKVDFSVPTGNFGNILAGYYAKEMGLPIDKLICSSNSNNILHDFISTGVYDTNRDFHKTMSPSMDILVSSNLERFLYHLSSDKEDIAGYYLDLSKGKRFSVEKDLVEKIGEHIVASWTDEEACLSVIKDINSRYDYPVDPHTAIAIDGAMKYPDNKTIVMSTASIYKFPSTVVKALYNEETEDFVSINKLQKDSGIDAHNSIKKLKELQPLHNNRITPDNMKGFIKNFIND